MGVSCDGCDGVDRTGSYTGNVALGGTLRPSLLVGAEFNGWTKSEDGATVRLANASAAGLLVPEGTVGLFLKGGAGYSRLSADNGIVSASNDGFGVLMGVGYDMRVARTTSIPVFNYFGRFRRRERGRVQLGLGVTSSRRFVVPSPERRRGRGHVDRAPHFVPVTTAARATSYGIPRPVVSSLPKVRSISVMNTGPLGLGR